MQWYGDEENCREEKNEKLIYTFMPSNIRQAPYLSMGYSDLDGGRGMVGYKLGENKKHLASILGPLRADIRLIKDIIKSGFKDLSQDQQDDIKDQLAEFNTRKKKLEELQEEYSYEAERLEDVKNKLISLERKLKDELQKLQKEGAYDAEGLIESCEKLLGSINKLLYPFYKKEALKKARPGTKIKLREPPHDLEGLEDAKIESLIGELETSKDLPGWIDRKEQVIYKAAESRRIPIFIGFVLFLISGFSIPFGMQYFKLYELVGVSDISYSLAQLLSFYLFGIIGFLGHLFKKVKEEKSQITCIDDFFDWFTSKWMAFIEMGVIFWAGFLLLVSLKQGSILNAFLLGYAIDSFSDTIFERYKLLAPAIEKIKL